MATTIMATTMAPHEPTSEHKELVLSSAALFMFGAIFGASFLSQWCQTVISPVLSSPFVATFLGLVSGLVFFLLSGVIDWRIQNVTDALRFNQYIFFLLLLPPIVFGSGFSLATDKRRQRNTWKNLGSILSLSFLGTSISIGVTSAAFYLLTYVLDIFGLSVRFTLQESLAIGCVLSPTDPVSVIGVLSNQGRGDGNQGRGDGNSKGDTIESLVVGEALLNDAIAIVLYRSIAGAGKHSRDVETAMRLGPVFGQFWLKFTLSLLLGLGMGLAVAVLCKLAFRKQNNGINGLGDTGTLDRQMNKTSSSNTSDAAASSAVVGLLILPWTACLVADVSSVSGVVAALASGWAIGRYALRAVSPAQAVTARRLFEALTLLAETCTFILSGLSLFVLDIFTGNWIAALVTTAFTVVVATLSRFVAVELTLGLTNLWLSRAQPHRHLAWPDRMLVSVGGLKGAVAVALALDVREDLGSAHGKAILAAAVLYTNLSVLVQSVVLRILVTQLNHSAKDSPKADPVGGSQLATSGFSLPGNGDGDGDADPNSVNAAFTPEPSAWHLFVWRFIKRGVVKSDKYLRVNFAPPGLGSESGGGRVIEHLPTKDVDGDWDSDSASDRETETETEIGNMVCRNP